MKITFLGTGTSHGVPVIGCDCRVCRSPDERDRRLRPSVYVEAPEGSALLIDAGPDLRAQALTHNIRRVDAILFTHGHADHILGLDEIRRFNALQGRTMPCYGDARTISEITATFKYVFDPATPKGGGVPRLELIEVGDPFHVGADSVVPVPIFHGTRPILGYRIGGFAYLTDCSRIAEGSWPLLEGLDLLVLDALRDRPHSTHFTLAEAVDVARRIAPRRTLFTHMCHDLGHAETCARLPEGMALAYDGLVVDVSDSRIRNSEPRVPSPEHPPFDKAQGRPGAPEGRAPSV